MEIKYIYNVLKGADMDKDKLDKLIEKAKQGAKDDFLGFVSGIYGVDECIFDHLWDIPVIAPYRADMSIPISLSTKTEDELLDIVDELIVSELKDSEGCCISLDKMAEKFTVEELEEWKNKLDSGELKLDYNAIIVYNEQKLRNEYRGLVKINSEKSKPKAQEELDKIFIDYVKKIITHEICILNENDLVPDDTNSKIKTDGSKISSWGHNDSIIDNINTKVNQAKYINRNHILADILGRMMNNYQNDDTIEDCLLRIVEDRNVKSQCNTLDDKQILTVYILFPKELTEWAIFGAYDYVKENKLEKMFMEVYGTDKPLQPCELKEKVEVYVATIKEGTLSEKQIQMIEMLNFSINKESMKDVITDTESIKDKYKREVYSSDSVLKNSKNKIKENCYDSENINSLKVVNNKTNIIKRFFNKILIFLKK